ncbi:AroM family protein [Microbacterium sp. 18062]|uniref:AroM family protein n=1 Tax=Microbacterium sp. 18062 TaxID=2681410 RepID=UPI00135A74F1|nr:AroM family protein [Microbacterium sp. 18062]
MTEPLDPRPVRVGIITTGQGPRDEYVAYHTNLLRLLGLTGAVVDIEHALDGLTEEQIDAAAAKDGDWWIGCHIQSPGSTGDRMGEGHREVFVDRAFMIQRVQRALDSLNDRGVELVIFCCAEEYPDGSFTSKAPLVLPFRLLLAQVGAFMETRESARIGLIVPSVPHIAQDLVTWSRASWAQRVDFVAAGWSSSGAGMAQELLSQGAGLDLVVLFGYGMGIAPADDPRLLDEISAAVGVPLITAHGVTTSVARGLLAPGMPDRTLAGVA